MRSAVASTIARTASTCGSIISCTAMKCGPTTFQWMCLSVSCRSLSACSRSWRIPAIFAPSSGVSDGTVYFGRSERAAMGCLLRVGDARRDGGGTTARVPSVPIVVPGRGPRRTSARSRGRTSRTTPSTASPSSPAATPDETSASATARTASATATSTAWRSTSRLRGGGEHGRERQCGDGGGRGAPTSWSCGPDGLGVGAGDGGGEEGGGVGVEAAAHGGQADGGVVQGVEEVGSGGDGDEVVAAGGGGEGVGLVGDAGGEVGAQPGGSRRRGWGRAGEVAGGEGDAAVGGEGVVGDAEVAVAEVGAGDAQEATGRPRRVATALRASPAATPEKPSGCRCRGCRVLGRRRRGRRR